MELLVGELDWSLLQACMYTVHAWFVDYLPDGGTARPPQIVSATCDLVTLSLSRIVHASSQEHGFLKPYPSARGSGRGWFGVGGVSRPNSAFL